MGRLTLIQPVNKYSRIQKAGVDFETNRIVAAFAVEHFGALKRGQYTSFLGKLPDGLSLWWGIHTLEERWTSLTVGMGVNRCVVCKSSSDGVWRCFPFERFNPVMARGLYCLGFDDEEVWRQLNVPLSEDEKRHLRERMPREFWLDGNTG